MSFRPGIDIRGKSFRQIHSTDGIAAGAWTTDRVVGIFFGGIGHVSDLPAHEVTPLDTHCNRFSHQTICPLSMT